MAPRRAGSWRKLHIGVDANTGEIVAAALTTNDVDDASQIGPLLDQVEGPVASFTGDGAYDRDSVYRTVTERDPDAAVIVPPRSTAVPSETADTEPTQRDCHLRCIDEKGRIGWQKVSDYNKRSRHRTLQAGDRQWAAFSQRWPSHHRDPRLRVCSESYAGARTPDLRPHHMNSDRVGDAATRSSIRATSPPSRQTRSPGRMTASRSAFALSDGTILPAA